MRTPQAPANAPETLATGADPETIVCPSCEQAVPRSALYCPYCCGEDGRRGATKRGFFIGGVFGLLAGGLFSAVWSSLVGPEQATGQLVLAITLACGAAGAIGGAILSRRR
ncbi:conserved hypothetical protein [Candidatus Accumulibacter aalborgensis]|uniref:Uncharacterized protein n=1 Tax=Candidatus Accumulibacter aalborgensis TaxID=1860102 RepID=A0A1A8XM82_9PROT|nr:zinc ribbon domain-containing protein [Candidatus Accumulibacter aalborgensis]SBT06279.1 conserved hypothetical protein [Candidatus Accumulibacter aalborgensis]